MEVQTVAARWGAAPLPCLALTVLWRAGFSSAWLWSFRPRGSAWAWQPFPRDAALASRPFRPRGAALRFCGPAPVLRSIAPPRDSLVRLAARPAGALGVSGASFF